MSNQVENPAADGSRPARGRGRRPGEGGTRTRILAAALQLFAAKGYSGASMRKIAEQAEVDPALIHHFFDSKDGLFQAAVSSRVDVSTIFDSLTEEEAANGVRMSRGEKIVRTFLSRWEDESTRPALVAVFRAGLADEAVSHVPRDHIQAAFVSCLSRIVPTETERTPEFASLVRAQLTGLVLLRYVLPVEPLASQDFEELLKLVALAVESLFDRPPD
ncbi:MULTISPECIES: TetR family transcriptional regulator [unclassified Streptomyces]|uniref:TetR/AcrR family transcriptional regulator n=1 Tax=unclassified Streptomyces TaxID=2593676 RepID=UPI003663D15E